MITDAQAKLRLTETQLAVKQLRDIHRWKHQPHDNRRHCAECIALDWLQDRGF